VYNFPVNVYDHISSSGLFTAEFQKFLKFSNMSHSTNIYHSNRGGSVERIICVVLLLHQLNIQLCLCINRAYFWNCGIEEAHIFLIIHKNCSCKMVLTFWNQLDMFSMFEP